MGGERLIIQRARAIPKPLHQLPAQITQTALAAAELSEPAELSFASANILFGMRSPTDWEFMAGPYISETGHGMTVAVGKTARVGGMAMPINLGVTSTAEGLRYSLTFGWNIGK